jgi:hypothetical protein
MGLSAQKKDLPSWKGNFFIISSRFYFGMVFPIFFISRRYASQMIPISLPWAAFGFLGLTEWVHRRWWKGIQQNRFSALVLLVVLIGLFIQGRITPTRERRFIYKEAGLWMKDHLPRDVNVMSRFPQEAFYSGLPWVQMFDGSYKETLQKARSRNVRYLVTDEAVTSYFLTFSKRQRRRENSGESMN